MLRHLTLTLLCAVLCLAFAGSAWAQQEPPAPLAALTDAPGDPGLAYKYYECQVETVLDLQALTPASEGSIATFTFPESIREDEFGLEWFGAIEVPADGDYTFYTESDDGSLLAIGDQIVVRNDYPHGVEEKSGTVSLRAGRHPIWVGFFEGAVSQAIKVSWSGPGIEKAEVPADVLTQHERVYKVPEGGVKETYLEWPELGKHFTVRVDTRDEPKLNVLQDTTPEIIEKCFPLMWEKLGTDRTRVPELVRFTARHGIDPPAYASGNGVVLNADYFIGREGDFGCVIHELGHVIQSYRPSPEEAGWLVEGIADYVRHCCQINDGWHIPSSPQKGSSYKNGYWVTASFLVFVEMAYDKDIVAQMNHALTYGEYRHDLWETYTGKTLDDLWADYLARWGKDVKLGE